MNIKKSIPNIVTCCNLLSGCIACVMALEGNLSMATLWIIIAAVFDFCDGLTARLLKCYSSMGKELDSLGDVVSFGVAPGFMLFSLLQKTCTYMTEDPTGGSYIPYIAFVIPVFSGLRLAKFNIDSRQTTSFIGLPVPAHALFWASLSCAMLPFVSIHPTAFVIGFSLLAIVTSLLLVSGIPMFSLKIHSLQWKGNECRYILLICGVVFIAFFHVLGITGTMLLYILLSIFNKGK
ncbi:MAG: CDP-alcohol phosphatidyltransferase family protein [Parabacteroides sp.]|nr:CDP-alcohol phosphatidyltransferase family protein [Parabacteroides sp.]